MNNANDRERQLEEIFSDDEVDSDLDCDSCIPGEYEDAMESQIPKILGERLGHHKFVC